MALKLKGSTSGFVAIDAPSVAGNNTLILPENTGSAQQLLGNDITAGVVTFTSVTVNRNGDLTVPGTISIGGTLTYEDVTSVDSVGIVTARSGVRINGGGLTIIGDTTGLSIKTKDPARRKSFRARHNCDNPGPRNKARYWSCRMWSGPNAVKNMLKK